MRCRVLAVGLRGRSVAPVLTFDDLTLGPTEYIGVHNAVYRCCQTMSEESICGLRTADDTTCHGCHLGSVQERSPSPVHKLGTNSVHLFVTRTVSQLLSVTSKLLFTATHGVTDN